MTAMTTARGTRWDDQAACRGRDDIDWFPHLTHARTDPRYVPPPLIAPLAVCRACPVLRACLADILTQPRSDRWGIRGAIHWRGNTGTPVDPLGILPTLPARRATEPP